VATLKRAASERQTSDGDADPGGVVVWAAPKCRSQQ